MKLGNDLKDNFDRINCIRNSELINVSNAVWDTINVHIYFPITDIIIFDPEIRLKRRM